MGKVKAFTTMELSIVMLMTSLIGSLAYGGYSLFVKQFHGYSRASQEALDIQQFIFHLKKDISHCNILYGRETVLECRYKQQDIVYRFENETYVLREQAGRTDTFRLEVPSCVFSFRGQPVSTTDPVTDEVRFTARYKKAEITPVFKKTYSNKDLMEIQERHGDRDQ